MKNLRHQLAEFARLVADQADKDPDFGSKLRSVLGQQDIPVDVNVVEGRLARPRNRRPAALFDPVALARSGEAALREKLASLSLEQLRDMVADYSMDPSKLVMKWKSPVKVADRIVELSLARAEKGDAFRTESDPNA